jgi:5-enolpyruvylshikimate-3-phosphate synthase
MMDVWSYQLSAQIVERIQREGVEVVGMEAAAVSYPRFLDDLASLR